MALPAESANSHFVTFALGLIYGSTLCTLECLPYVASYIAGIGADFRKGVTATLIYNSGRLAASATLIWVKNQTRNITYFRTLIQVTFGLPQSPPTVNAPRELLLGAETLEGWFPDGLTVPVLACYYLSGRTVTCAVWQIQSYIYPFWNPGIGFWGTFYTNSGIERLAIVFGLLIAMSLILGRFFCGWICPFSLYMDLLSNVRAIFKKGYRKFSEKTNDAVHQLRYVIIAAFLILSIIFCVQAIFGLQLISGTQQGEYIYNYFSAPYCQGCPMKTLCVLTETSLGYMDPAYVLESITEVFYEAGYFLTSLNLAVLVLVTIVAFAYRRLRCRICPLGGLIALFSRYPPFKWFSIMRLNKVEEKCTKCGICKRICLKLNVAGKTLFKSRNWVNSR